MQLYSANCAKLPCCAPWKMALTLQSTVHPSSIVFSRLFHLLLHCVLHNIGLNLIPWQNTHTCKALSSRCLARIKYFVSCVACLDQCPKFEWRDLALRASPAFPEGHLSLADPDRKQWRWQGESAKSAKSAKSALCSSFFCRIWL